jgi:hypothetical protein
MVGPDAARTALAGAGMRSQAIHVQSPSLEDAFIALVERTGAK